jgi:hypothetical protein
MEVLLYNNLVFGKHKKAIDTTISFLKEGNFRAADVKKMPTTGYYRAKLDDTNRLLFQIGSYQDKKYILVLEIIHNHEYEKSKFLNGVAVDSNKLVALNNEQQIQDNELTSLGYVNTKQKHFHVLDKILSFDDVQTEILDVESPCILIGSAGSGKTALTLEKVKQLQGKVLYVTLSNYLIENASMLYSSFGYENTNQEVEFLSFYEYISTLQVPNGKEVHFREFNMWISKYKQSHKITDAYKIYEEFKGVLTGSNITKEYLSLQDYKELGIKQSIINAQDRDVVYELFEKYLKWLKDENYFDLNILSHQLLKNVTATFDYVVIDEVQDMTNVQILLVLKALKNANNFFLCGDSNQIVHPNFFSWSQIKSMFYKQDLASDIIRILATNYRNTPEVTKIANMLLLVKNARFGSIDKESTYLVKPNTKHIGEVEFLENLPKTNTELNKKTKQSTQFAVIVLRNEDKAKAREFFQTPLLFSIHEAKGLEYENIILFNIISTYNASFKEIASGVSTDDLLEENLKFSRAKDKSDKSLDEYKFYINSLYVGITRAVRNLYVIESNKRHELLELLGLTNFIQTSNIKNQTSSKEDWQKEAHKLELQGKKEQAEAIRKEILQIQEVPWQVLDNVQLKALLAEALDPAVFNKKAKDKLYKYALYFGEIGYINKLIELQYQPANKWKAEGVGIIQRYLTEYTVDNYKPIEQNVNKYGVDYKNEWNLTPFTIAISMGATKIAEQLILNGTNTAILDNYGRNALQIAMLQGYKNKNLKIKVLNKFYNNLKNDSLKIKIKDKLIKLVNRQGEYFMLHFMIATLRTKILLGTQMQATDRPSYVPIYAANDFLNFFDGLTNHVIPDYRKARAYVSSILAKNEALKLDSSSKQLFLRVQTGMYIPNPNMEILCDDNWVNIYDIIELEDIEQNFAQTNHKIFHDIKLFHQLQKLGVHK